MDPGADDMSPSPDRSEDLENETMADSNPDREQSDDKSPSGSKDGNEHSAKRNAKDPSRPRRKKARRACFACQRAHLTCGDERPCLRCIKRGLQDHCHDGVRKKAKYLHDAPNEAVMPGNYNGSSNQQQPTVSTSLPQSAPDNVPSASQSRQFYNSNIPMASYSTFGQPSMAGSAQSPPTGDSSLMDFYGAQQPTSLPPPAFSAGTGQQSSSMQNSIALDQSQNAVAPPFDPADPSFFTFDVSDFNFGNHYGALEFGMLGQMSSGVGDVSDDKGLMGSMNAGGNVNFDNPGAFNNPSNIYSFTPSSAEFPGWQLGPTQSPTLNNAGLMYGSNHNNTNNDAQNVPHAFAIGEGNGSISDASPIGNHHDFAGGYSTSPNSSASFPAQGTHTQDFARQHAQHQHSHQQQQQQTVRSRSSFPSSTDIHRQDMHRKRKRDPSQIYSAVKAPYSYTTGFHSLTAFIQKRFSPQKTLRVAKALASIRPSFIACTKQLNREDLIFMEKCFQRTLWEYEDFINAYGTPTVICRRTGEVAAVSKEFSLLTGWRRDVLLGKEANLNVNTGGTSGNMTGNSSRGTATPRIGHSGALDAQATAAGRPQPVFIAELLDDDSVIQFYEDFAKLAFGDSRGYVTSPCKLLKYKTRDDRGWSDDDDALAKTGGPGGNGNGNNRADRKGRDRGASQGGSGAGDPLISGEAGMNLLGDRDGKVDCMYCWSVKRDVFDIPMLVVMNVSVGNEVME